MPVPCETPRVSLDRPAFSPKSGMGKGDMGAGVGWGDLRPVETERDLRRPGAKPSMSSPSAASERCAFCDEDSWGWSPPGVTSCGGGWLLTREGELGLGLLLPAAAGSCATYLALMRLDELL